MRPLIQFWDEAGKEIKGVVGVTAESEGARRLNAAFTASGSSQPMKRVKVGRLWVQIVVSSASPPKPKHVAAVPDVPEGTP